MYGFGFIFDNFYFGDKGFFFNGSVVVFSVMFVVIFVFIGIEVIGVVVGEIKNVSEVMFKVIKVILWWIVFFFLGFVFVIFVFLFMNDFFIM